jgi:copper chaperone CopZ
MTQTVIIKIHDMDCTACAMNIDGELEDTPGVKSAFTNYAKGEAKVEFNEQQVSLDQLLEAVKRAGYNAEVISS